MIRYSPSNYLRLAICSGFYVFGIISFIIKITNNLICNNVLYLIIINNIILQITLNFFLSLEYIDHIKTILFTKEKKIFPSSILYKFPFYYIFPRTREVETRSSISLSFIQTHIHTHASKHIRIPAGRQNEEESGGRKCSLFHEFPRERRTPVFRVSIS